MNEDPARDWSWWTLLLNLGVALTTLVVVILLYDQLVAPALINYFVQVDQIGNVLAGRDPEDSRPWTWVVSFAIVMLAMFWHRRGDRA